MVKRGYSSISGKSLPLLLAFQATVVWFFTTIGVLTTITAHLVVANETFFPFEQRTKLYTDVSIFKLYDLSLKDRGLQNEGFTHKSRKLSQNSKIKHTIDGETSTQVAIISIQTQELFNMTSYPFNYNTISQQNDIKSREAGKASPERSIPDVSKNSLSSTRKTEENNYNLVIAEENNYNLSNIAVGFSPIANSSNVTSDKSYSTTLFACKVIIMSMIIIVAVLGNSLVIASISLHRRLHCPANYLLVSLASADLLVALCAMTFNLSVELLNGDWIFGDIMCDLWNSFDVYFSTVSILHLCSISVDRYYAIVKPLEYPLTMTNKMLTFMLCQAWLAPALISFLPIFLGWYSTKDHLKQRLLEPNKCTFKVNATFAVMSSSMSFWLPCTVMAIMYFRIFQEARKQERAILTRASSSASSAAARLNGSHTDPRQQLLAALQGVPLSATPIHQAYIMKSLTGRDSSRSSSTASAKYDTVGGCSNSSRAAIEDLTPLPPPPPQIFWPDMVPTTRRHASSSTSATTGVHPGKREHKAARTLGLIMGAFVMCWLPFFTWYLTTNLCGRGCNCPPGLVTTVFWIGYFNSTLNPFIYAYVRADFRHAFRSTLTRCCRPRYPTADFV